MKLSIIGDDAEKTGPSGNDKGGVDIPGRHWPISRSPRGALAEPLEKALSTPKIHSLRRWIPPDSGACRRATSRAYA